jgi:hypothetical protein
MESTSTDTPFSELVTSSNLAALFDPVESEFVSSLSSFDIITITCNAFCFVTAVAVLVLRKHALQMLLIMGTFIPGLITVSSTGYMLRNLGYFKSSIIAFSSGILVSVAMWISFYFLPCTGPACFLSFMLLSLAVLIECSTGLNLGLIALLVPIFFALLLVLIVYNISRVPMIRSKDFTWPDSLGVAALHVLISCTSVGFGLVSSGMFFIDPIHTNLMSLIQQKLNAASTVDTNKSSVGLAAWLGTSFITALTRTEAFDRICVWLWRKLRWCGMKKAEDSAKLLDSSTATEFGIRGDDDASMCSEPVKPEKSNKSIYSLSTRVS